MLSVSISFSCVVVMESQGWAPLTIAGVDVSDAAFVSTKRLRVALSLIVGKVRSRNGPGSGWYCEAQVNGFRFLVCISHVSLQFIGSISGLQIDVHLSASTPAQTTAVVCPLLKVPQSSQNANP